MNNIPISNKLPEFDVALQAVSEAGKTILEIYGENYETSTKHDDSPITEADVKSNEIIKSILSKTPHHILSEEDKD
ncbi:MAG: 3'(2'),5'-bisphosphate nucleotidase CysQ, partial [Nitrosopumilus sp.]